MQLRIWIAIAIAAVGWGTGGVATRAALADGVPPIALTAFRSSIAALLMLGVLAAMRRPWRRTARSLDIGVKLSLGNLIAPFLLLTYAVRYASAGFVGVLLALVPIATAGIAHFRLPDEPLHRRKVTGLAVGFGGVALLLASGASGLETGGRPLLAALLAFFAVAAIASANVYAKGRSQTYDALGLITVQFLFGTLVLSAAALAIEGVPTDITAWGWTLLVYMAVATTAGPNLLYYWVLRHVSSTKASMIGYLVPMTSVGAGVLLLDERLEWGLVAGGIVILVGVVITSRAEGYVHRRTPRSAG